jgi:hypothetical protein|eukprot:SAG25_NODE_235_length_11344_cov_3.848911_8_plen_142_part_00
MARTIGFPGRLCIAAEAAGTTERRQQQVGTSLLGMLGMIACVHACVHAHVWVLCGTFAQRPTHWLPVSAPARRSAARPGMPTLPTYGSSAAVTAAAMLPTHPIAQLERQVRRMDRPCVPLSDCRAAWQAPLSGIVTCQRPP